MWCTYIRNNLCKPLVKTLCKVSKFFALGFICKSVSAHEMTPTYFKTTNSVYNNIYKTELSLFNSREEQLYYEITVYDDDWNKVPFATSERLLKIDQFKRKDFELFFKKRDLDRVVYVCTKSKTPKGQTESTGVTSRICSKRKE